MQHANKQNGACRNVQRRSGCFFNNAGQCLSRKSNNNGGIVAPNSVVDTLNTPGVPLDSPTKTFMNGKFNHDFSGVRMHDDPLAHRSSADIHALAYTHGNHIVFGRGQYKPNGNEGKKTYRA